MNVPNPAQLKLRHAKGQAGNVNNILPKTILTNRSTGNNSLAIKRRGDTIRMP
jgi:hypothetical protein